VIGFVAVVAAEGAAGEEEVEEAEAEEAEDEAEEAEDEAAENGCGTTETTGFAGLFCRPACAAGWFLSEPSSPFSVKLISVGTGISSCLVFAFDHLGPTLHPSVPSLPDPCPGESQVGSPGTSVPDGRHCVGDSV